jgi:hypothetical protein
MRNNWPYFIVASFLNAVLITGAFIEFKLRGVTAIDHAARPTGLAWLNINPFLFGAGMFVVSLLVIWIIIGIKELVTGIIARVHSFNESLANTQPTAANPFDVA